MPKAARASNDLKQLQGVWNVASLEMDGRTIPAAMLGGAKVTVQGSRFTSSGMGAAYEGDLEIDATVNPKAFSLKFTAGPEQGNTNYGIYELDGDTWRICLNMRGQARPKKFAGEPGTGNALEVLKRETAADKLATAFDLTKVRFEPAQELEGEWSMVSAALGGQPLEKSMLKIGKRVFRGNDATVLFGAQVYGKAKFTLDRSATPLAIDYYNVEGANAGKKQLGILKVDRKGLTLCLAAPGQPRPDAFTSTAADGRTLTVWTRTRK